MSAKKHPVLTRKKGLYLKDTGHKGRGVFCREPVRAGAVLETTAALILNEKGTDALEKTVLRQYSFIVGGISKKLRQQLGVKKPERTCAVIMGVMTFCNHSQKPNAEILWEEIDGTVYYSLETTRAIPKGTEICTSYGRNWFEDRDTKKH